jgi:hypothetical protein
MLIMPEEFKVGDLYTGTVKPGAMLQPARDSIRVMQEAQYTTAVNTTTPNTTSTARIEFQPYGVFTCGPRRIEDFQQYLEMIHGPTKVEMIVCDDKTILLYPTIITANKRFIPVRCQPTLFVDSTGKYVERRLTKDDSNLHRMTQIWERFNILINVAKEFYTLTEEDIRELNKDNPGSWKIKLGTYRVGKVEYY